MIIYTCSCIYIVGWLVSTIFQLYRGSQFFLGEETRVPGENHPSITSHWQTLSHNVVLSTSPWTGFEPTTLVVIGTDCTGSCISNYHTITTVFTLLETETDRKMNLWWTFLACFPVTANKFYIYWHCTYIVFILQCQKLQNNYHIVWKEQY
jgi:hypothetical protein